MKYIMFVLILKETVLRMSAMTVEVKNIYWYYYQESTIYTNFWKIKQLMQF